MTTGSQHPKFQAQLALEEEMRSLGVRKFRDRILKAREKGQESRTDAVTGLILHTHGKMVEAIEGFVTRARTGGAGRKHSALPFIELVGDFDVIAHLTLRVALDSVSTRERLTRCALNLATLLEDEVHFKAFADQMPVAFDKMHKNAATSSNERYRRNAMLMPARKLGVQLDEWSNRDKLILGTKLIELFCETTGLAKLTRQSESSANTPIYIEATAETLAWIDNENNRMEWLAPIYMPTIVPPKPWTSPFSGGYWSGRVRRLTLVKTKNRRYLEELAARDMPIVYESINALQETAWAINTRVLDVMTRLWETKSELADIPGQQRKEEMRPERPDWLTKTMTREEMDEEQLVHFKQWKQDCARSVADYGVLVSKRLSFVRMLTMANRFRDEGEFYYPHQLDWRGRAYPVSLYLTPQGNDAQRGLLEFANAVPLTDDDGVRWLAVHGAGLWGVDKVDMEHRIAWVEEHSEEICAAARDPFESRFWTEAEKPWQALAFCFDWLGWKTEGYAFASSLPVQMDGTCNGLQNFWAILRNAIGGAAVNLVPADKPQDIYSIVAEAVARQVEADLTNETRFKLNRKDSEGNKIEVEGPTIASVALGWHGHINRKVTKRPVMTLAYGARQFGFIEQVFEDTVTPWKRERPAEFPFEGSGWLAADYMGRLIWKAVQTVVVAAAQAMEWLQKAARAAAKEGLPVMWSTPSGFLVQQAYLVPNQKRIELTFEKVRLRLSINGENPKIDTRKQASGISPNWVHSLDASHMSRTIRRCHELGIRSFSFIHDSYGTHAGNAYVLAQSLREEFVSMYEPDVLGRFRDELLQQLPGVELDPLPPMGTLDLQQVLESPFFFA